MKSIFTEQKNNTPKQDASTPIPPELEKIINDIDNLNALKSEWNKRMQGLEQLQIDIADYCSQMHAKKTHFSALQKTDPSNQDTMKKLTFYTDEQAKAEQLLLKTREDFRFAEKQIQVIDEHLPSAHFQSMRS